MTTRNATQLPEMTDDKRLAVYKLITSACTHLYSKGKLQAEKWNAIAPIFAELTRQDPTFMVQFAVWASRKDSKDMKVVAAFFNGLSDADGTPFFAGAKANKPNYRRISAALLQGFDPHLAERYLELSNLKFGVNHFLNDARHFPQTMQKAFIKYLRYREQFPDMMMGIRRSGLSGTMRNIYRMSHVSPSDDACAIFGWSRQKDGRQIEALKLPDFSNMKADAIAAYLKEARLAPQMALSILPKDKITAAVAKALLEGATGNQAIVFYNWFNRNGFLDVASIRALFKDKVQSSTTAVDRIDTLTKNADEGDRKEMAAVRSVKRKSQANLSAVGKIFMHVDKSSSMSGAIEFAKDRAAIVAECVQNPSQNFGWGLFGQGGTQLPLPAEFTKEAFHQRLYGVRASDGATDCVALYPSARKFGAEVDIYVTDQGHNVGDIVNRINSYHAANPTVAKPRAAVIVSFGASRTLETALKNAGIPTVSVDPAALVESALVAQSIRNAVIGELAIIDEIMSVPLPDAPKWYDSVSTQRRAMAREIAE